MGNIVNVLLLKKINLYIGYCTLEKKTSISTNIFVVLLNIYKIGLRFEVCF